MESFVTFGGIWKVGEQFFTKIMMKSVERKRMTVRWRVVMSLFLILMAGGLVFSSCASGRKYPPKKKQIKKGKPIPCPMKDC